MRRIATGMVDALRGLLRRLGVESKEGADVGRALDVAERQVLPALDAIIDLSDGEVEMSLEGGPDALAEELKAGTEFVELQEPDNQSDTPD